MAVARRLRSRRETVRSNAGIRGVLKHNGGQCELGPRAEGRGLSRSGARVVDLDPWPSALGPRPLALGPRPLALGPRPLALSPWPSALGPWPSALGPRPLALSPWPSALSPWPSALFPPPLYSPRAARRSSPDHDSAAPAGHGGNRGG